MQLQQNKDKEEAVHLIVECVQNGYKEQMVELMKYGVPLDQKAKVKSTLTVTVRCPCVDIVCTASTGRAVGSTCHCQGG